ncbi:hypothetical protein MKW94_020162 [Papaver nudicaule]|uniref:Phospholipase A1 n=1 Tax=Papaver nudicaule TaxID=74823 RepID=A0AA41SL96_PAPNU|nr:hypothetical protein [Papaver nudicaule]
MEIPKLETQRWEEILGSNHWEGLLEPLDLNLRQLILRCGDFCQATYDSFDGDKHSKYCGSCRYGKKSFFKKVALESAANDYFVDSFLYATSPVVKSIFSFSYSKEAWDRESNWIGYIAVSTDEASERLGRREIYVAWRGTIRTLEWMNVFDPEKASVKPLLKPQNHNTKTNATEEHTTEHRHWYDILICKQNDDTDANEEEDIPQVMKGWLTIYNSDNPNSQFTKLSARTQVLSKIRRLATMYKDENVSVLLTGHSLGASLAILCAFDLVENGLSKVPVTAIVFGSPQIGDKAFSDKLATFTNLRILHVKNTIDLIPLYPSKLLGFSDTGTELEVDTRKSTSLKDSKNPSDWHNLQAILHIVAGWNGKQKEFELKVDRNVALVNKSCDYLKDDQLVPASWWVEKNKGMVLEDGKWAMAPPDEEDIPVPECEDIIVPACY